MRPDVVTFWHGPLDRLRLTRLRSQAAVGHQVTAYSFEQLAGLPDGDATVHFDVFAARDEGEVLVFALGDRQAGQPSLYGHITIKHK